MKKLVMFLFLTLASSVASAQMCPTPTQLDTDLTSASQADTLSLAGTSPLNCPEILMNETWSGGKLIFSDAPESPSAKGKLYDDNTLPTTGAENNRIFVYHVNGKSSGNMRFTVLIKNRSSSSATLTVKKVGLAGPSTAYAYVGKQAFNRWESSSAGSPVTVPAGGTVRLDTTFDSTNVAPGNLMHGIWDYSINQDHEVMICALNQNDNPLNVCPGLAVSAKDSHVRGTFPFADKVYDTATAVTIDTADGVQSIQLASGSVNDTWAVGTDVTTGLAATNGGNYGILYRMHLSISSSDGQDLGFLFNPRAGAWGGAVNAMAGLTPGGIFLVPPSTGTLSDNTKGVVEGKYAPSSVPSTAWLQFMPTGASSFPLRFIAVPF